MDVDEIVDQYMHGYCMFLAAAIHHKSKLPIGLLTVTTSFGTYLGHAWVELPDGKCLDIQGVQTLNEITAESVNFKVYRNTTLEHLEQLSKCDLSMNEEEVRIALKIALERGLI